MHREPRRILKTLTKNKGEKVFKRNNKSFTQNPNIIDILKRKE